MVLIALTKDECSRRAVQFMSTKNYTMISQTETSISFDDGKDINTGILILGILFLLIGAILYYLLAKKHTLIVTFNEVSGGVNVESSTNTTKSLKDAQDFLMTLPKL
jgi:hypothetical protein